MFEWCVDGFSLIIMINSKVRLTDHSYNSIVRGPVVYLPADPYTMYSHTVKEAVAFFVLNSSILLKIINE